MENDPRLSLRRIAGLLCHALAAFMTILLVMCVINRIFWHKGYSAVEDLVVFSIMAVIATLAAFAGYFMRPGSFSLRTMLIVLTVAFIVMAELAILVRSE
jgi:hypothetical protein